MGPGKQRGAENNLGAYIASSSSAMGRGVSYMGRGASSATSDFFSARSNLYDEDFMDKAKARDKIANKRFGQDKNSIGSDKNKQKAYKQTLSSGDYFKKAAFGVAGGGQKREAFMNSMGLLTRHQKKIATKGGMAGMLKWIIPGSMAIEAIDTLMDGGGIKEYVGDYVIPGMTAVGGWHIAKNLGFGVSSLMSRGRLGMIGKAAGVAAGVAGGITGLAAGIVVGEGLKQMTDSNSMANQISDNLKYAHFVGDAEETNNTMTHRRAVMQRLNMSGLNDRGTLLGNEASILQGIL